MPNRRTSKLISFHTISAYILMARTDVSPTRKRDDRSCNDRDDSGHPVCVPRHDVSPKRDEVHMCHRSSIANGSDQAQVTVRLY